MTMRGEDQNHHHHHHHHHQRCELCTNAAAVYCPSDSAYLCFTCDARVHYANFLVARHVRAALCSYCFNFSGYQFSGHIQSHTRSICRSCIPTSVSAVDHSHESSISTATGASGNTDCHHRHRELPAVKREELRGRGQRKNSDRKAGLTVGDHDLSTFPSETRSSAGKELPPPLCKLGETRGTAASPRFHEKAEAVFKSWCRKLGGLALRLDNSDPEWSIAFLSRNALHIFRGMPPALPGRLSLAASFWLTLIQYCRLSSSCNKKRGSVSSSPSDCVASSRASQDLCKRIEEISGVPANSIFSVGSRFYAAAAADPDHDHHHDISKKRRLASPPGGGVVNILNDAGGDQEEGWGETDP